MISGQCFFRSRFFYELAKNCTTLAITPWKIGVDYYKNYATVVEYSIMIQEWFTDLNCDSSILIWYIKIQCSILNDIWIECPCLVNEILSEWMRKHSSYHNNMWHYTMIYDKWVNPSYLMWIILP